MKRFTSTKLFLAMALLLQSASVFAQADSDVVRPGVAGPQMTAEEFCERAGCVVAPNTRQIVPAGGTAGTPTLADGGTGIRWYYNSDPFVANPTAIPATSRGTATRTQLVDAAALPNPPGFPSDPVPLYDFEFHPPLGSNSMQFNLQAQSSFVSSTAALATPSCADTLQPLGRTMAIFLRAQFQRVDTTTFGPVTTLRQGDVGQVPSYMPYTAFPTRNYTAFVPLVSAFDPATGSYPRYRLWVEVWAVPGNTGSAAPFSYDCFVPLNPNLLNIGLAVTSSQMLLTF